MKGGRKRRSTRVWRSTKLTPTELINRIWRDSKELKPHQQNSTKPKPQKYMHRAIQILQIKIKHNFKKSNKLTISFMRTISIEVSWPDMKFDFTAHKRITRNYQIGQQKVCYKHEPLYPKSFLFLSSAFSSLNAILISINISYNIHWSEK
jgi:hypothetical protein